MKMRLMILSLFMVWSAAAMNLDQEKKDLCSAFVNLEDQMLEQVEEDNLWEDICSMMDDLFRYVDKHRYKYDTIIKNLYNLEKQLSRYNKKGKYNDLIKLVNANVNYVKSLKDDEWVRETVQFASSNTRQAVFMMDEDLDSEESSDNEKRIREEIKHIETKYAERKIRAEQEAKKKELQSKLMHPVSYDPKYELSETEFWMRMNIENAKNKRKQ